MQRTTKSGPHDHTDNRAVVRRKKSRNLTPHDVRAEDKSTEAASHETMRSSGGSQASHSGLDASALDARRRSRRIAERARARVDNEGYTSPAARIADSRGSTAPRVVRRVRSAEHEEETTETVKRPSKRRKMRNPFQRASLLTMTVASVAALVGLSLFVMIVIAQKDYNNWQAQVEFRQAQLAALEEQHDVGERRLAALASPKGRDQLLVEHGYLRPGDRILLFPATPAEKQAADIPKNDLSPHPPLSPDSGSDPNASVWKRAADTLRSWWNSGH